MTLLDNDRPFRHRVRAGAAFVAQENVSGTPLVDQISVTEKRLELSGGWAPLDRLVVTGTLPLIRRDVAYPSLERKRAQGIGDLEVRVKGTVWIDRAFAPRHVVALVAGGKVPTTRWARDRDDSPLPAEQQVGSGAFSPLVGVSYSHFRYPWSAHARVEASTPVAHHPDYRPSPSLRTTLAAQRQIVDVLALNVAVDTRTNTMARENGHLDADSSGSAVFLSPALLVTPVTDLVIFVLARVPVVQRLSGDQREHPTISGGVVYDF